MLYKLYFVASARDKDHPSNYILQPDGNNVFHSLEAVDAYMKENWKDYWDLEVVALPYWRMEKPEPEPQRVDQLRM